MADAKPKKSAPKLFDVAKPGKSAPSSTSKPVLITNRPVLKDPMVIRVDGADEDANEAEKVNVDTEMTHKVDVKPLHIDLTKVLKTDEPKEDEENTPEEVEVKTEEPETPAEEKPEQPAEPEKPEESETPEAPAEPTESEKPAPSEHRVSGEKVIQPPEPSTEEPETPAEEKPAEQEPEPEAESLGGLDDEASLDNSETPVLSEKEAKVAEADKKKVEEQEKIIASGEYYLPINSVEKRRTKRKVILGTLLVLVLIAAAALAAWDAGVFSIPGFTAPTDYL